MTIRKIRQSVTYFIKKKKKNIKNDRFDVMKIGTAKCDNFKQNIFLNNLFNDNGLKTQTLGSQVLFISIKQIDVTELIKNKYYRLLT